MKYIDFKRIEYLKDGNEKQKRSFYVLSKINIFEILKEYNPLLVGTIPIGIDTYKSDLDIVCSVYDFNSFRKVLDCYFAEFKGYSSYEDCINEVIVCNFYVEDFEIEIYASKEQSEKTNGYRHMIIEDRLLNLASTKFKEEIIELKEKGLKTEPAFAKLLNLEGNPYEELLKFENYSDEKMIEYLDKLGVEVV